MTMPSSRVQVGRVPLDVVTLPDAIDRIVELARSGRGGTVYTPNVDHVVVAEEDAAFRDAYSEVSLSLVDGMPVFWATRLLGRAVPEKVSGSDLFEPLLERAANSNLPVFFVGGGPGVAEMARDRMVERYPGLRVVGIESPRIDAEGNAEGETELLDSIRAARPALVFVACGAPKSELFCHKHRSQLSPAVLVCVGAAIDFAAGTAVRAPRWMSRVGLEWAYRLSREPRRLARRYLLRDPKFFWILARQLSSELGRAPVPESTVRPVGTGVPEGAAPLSGVRTIAGGPPSTTMPESGVVARTSEGSEGEVDSGPDERTVP